jgi:hypothetical protein
MMEQVQMKHLSNENLHSDFSLLASKERLATAAVIEYIKEIDRRRLYIDYGHTSLFSYLTIECKYSAASAQRRIDAARLLNEAPEIKAHIENGALNLNQISAVAQAARQGKKLGREIDTAIKQKALEAVIGKSQRETEKLVAQKLNLPPATHESKRAQSDGSQRIELTLNEVQLKLLSRVKELISHQNPNPTMAELFEFLAGKFLRANDPLQLSMAEVETETAVENANAIEDVGANEVEAGAGAANADADEIESKDVNDNGNERKIRRIYKTENKNKENKTLTPLTRRKVFQRGHSCQHIDSRTGRKCESRFQLQVDHILSKWRGGNNSLDNLQALCGVHNREKYRREVRIT